MPHILRQDGALKGCKGEHVWILIMKLPTELIFAFFGRQNASVRSAWSARARGAQDTRKLASASAVVKNAKK